MSSMLFSLIFQVTIYHLLKLFQTETDIMLGKKSLVVEFYDELVSVYHYELQHEISNNVVCATSKGSDQPAHMHSLIRAFASRLNIL